MNDEYFSRFLKMHRTNDALRAERKREKREYHFYYRIYLSSSFFLLSRVNIKKISSFGAASEVQKIAGREVGYLVWIFIRLASLSGKYSL